MIRQETPRVVIDDSHGQANWLSTGFSSREIHSNFSGLGELVSGLRGEIRTSKGQDLQDVLTGSSLLIVPPPAGKYDSKHERWRKDLRSLFQPEEIAAVLRFIWNGGALMGFGYRFGDSFTDTNLKDLFSPLGCHLNDDAVVDLDQLKHQHPLKSQFTTSADLLPERWSVPMVSSVHWRTMATFTILPGANARPLALSPGGRCITFNRTTREISFESLPVAVAGTYGRGRFVLFGGPHALETGALGLLHAADNARFAVNVLGWLLPKPEPDKEEDSLTVPRVNERHLDEPTADRWKEFSRIEGRGKGENVITSVERVLRRKGVLRALCRARWAP
ncbi:MAG: hypothetical protein AB9869_03745 [Verrucomicrobiia bacterium]